MRTERAFGALAVTVLVIAAMQVSLFLVSWLVNAAWPESVVRSLLSNEGIRWFWGTFASNVASPPLVWILVLAMAYGALRASKLTTVLWPPKVMRTYRQTFALRVTAVLLLLFLGVIAFISFVPHAALLSATGQLFPSSFSRSLIPTLAFCVAVAAITYGVLAGVLRNTSDVVRALSDGIASAAPLIVLYVMAAELVLSVCYIFRWQ